ncbi:hypothetical protein BCR42DRAFT_399662 [Absidia repens]|uniref:PH domain-containing protein n=1 Tax=Absidia repens TaxID=90262 RepID=A0A1X2J086_9FUNG|nr:hypothetical protein BCR42DRAFT_399662 [Absidia repens]
MFGETAEGWLSKTGLLGLTARHRRYCVLSGNELRYYKQKTDSRPAGAIDLKHYSIAEKDSGKQYPYGFRIVSQCRNHRSYIFYADHEQGCQYWMDIINATLDPFVGKHHACDMVPVSLPPPEEETYSVLDKWLNRLDLNDHNQRTTPASTTTPSSVASLSGTYNSTTTSTTITTTSKTATSTTLASSFSSYMSPTLRPYRTSTESLDSIPSETTLSSSAGSRAQLSNAIFTPHHHHHHSHNHAPHHTPSQYYPINSPPTQYQTLTSSSHSKRLSNPMAFLSSIKQQSPIRSNQQQSCPGDSSHSNNSNNNHHKSPPWSSLDSIPSSVGSSNNNSGSSKIVAPRKDWESEELFDFEDEMIYSNNLLRDTAAGTRHPPPPPPLS